VKVLLDECLPLDFRRSFPNHDAHTAQWADLKGKKNGELLRLPRLRVTTSCSQSTGESLINSILLAVNSRSV
jgi:hypothetical protein